MKLYAAYDRCAGTYCAPFIMENDAMALRAFNHGIKDSPFASDMSLYSLGEYDVNTGKILPEVSFLSNFVGEV